MNAEILRMSAYCSKYKFGKVDRQHHDNFNAKLVAHEICKCSLDELLMQILVAFFTSES